MKPIISWLAFGLLLVLTGGFAGADKRKARPAEDITITAHAPVLPVLRGLPVNPFLRLTITLPDGAPEKRIRRIAAALNKESLGDILRLDVFRSEPGKYPGGEAIASLSPRGPAFDIPVDLTLGPGVHSLWLSVTLKEEASLAHPIELHCTQVRVGGGKKIAVREDGSSFVKRQGVALRRGGDEGVNTYRIPGIVTTGKGTLIAVYDIRYLTSRDLPGHIDVGMSRSTDCGRTWEPMKIIMDMGPPHENNGVGDPSILYDPATGKIWVAALWSKGNRSIAGSGPGLSPDETGQFVLTSSSDDGLTWVPPYTITPQVKNPAWKLFFQGPGAGIAMADGTLVFPAQYWDAEGMPHANIVYSKDHGVSWRTSPAAPKANTTESQVVETTPGTLMLNMRDNRGLFRSVATTTDLGAAWTEHHTSRGALPDPVCQGSLIKAAVPVDGVKRDVLFFCNPDKSKAPREKMTLKASLDLGESWLPRHQLLIDERRCYGYSSLTMVDDSTVGVLYEGEKDLYFVRVPVAEILAKPDSYLAIPTVDLDQDKARQVVVDREPGQYLGHPTTLLLEDNRTILTVYPKGHGRGAIVYKKSHDGGRTWSERLPTPPSWETSLEVPTLFRVEDAAGKKRVILFSGLYPARMAVSEDDGASWSELRPAGDWGGIVVMGCMIPLNTGKGHYMTMFHDDMRFFTRDGEAAYRTDRESHDSPSFTLYKSFSYDGGLTWSFPEAVYQSRAIHVCEPGIVRSPDGAQIAVLLRENSRRANSQIIFSNDEGKTWTEPRPLPNELTGDRHVAKYAPDGRLLITFRDVSPRPHNRELLRLAREQGETNYGRIAAETGLGSPTEGDWVAWVGAYDDLVQGKPGQYRIRLKDNTKGWDTTYPGLELLPDGTFITTTYGHWEKGEEPYILSVRFSLKETDAMVEKMK